MIKPNDPIHIFKNDEYPHGYTISTSRKESQELAKELMNRTISNGVCTTAGQKHWKTGKSAYWIVFFDEPYQVKPEYTAITSFS